jgi:hypothetical protein
VLSLDVVDSCGYSSTQIFIYFKQQLTNLNILHLNFFLMGKSKSMKRQSRKGHHEAETYYVESIVDKRTSSFGVQFKVKWMGYPESANTWEPEDHLNPVRNSDFFRE